MTEGQGVQRGVGTTPEIPRREPQSSVGPLVPHLWTLLGRKATPPPSPVKGPCRGLCL